MTRGICRGTCLLPDISYHTLSCPMYISGGRNEAATWQDTSLQLRQVFAGFETHWTACQKTSPKTTPRRLSKLFTKKRSLEKSQTWRPCSSSGTRAVHQFCSSLIEQQTVQLSLLGRGESRTVLCQDQSTIVCASAEVQVPILNKTIRKGDIAPASNYPFLLPNYANWWSGEQGSVRQKRKRLRKSESTIEQQLEKERRRLQSWAACASNRHATECLDVHLAAQREPASSQACAKDALPNSYRPYGQQCLP